MPSKHYKLALFALVAGSLLLVGGGGWHYWLCDLASYNCPASGCGEVPQENCMRATELFEALAILGAVLLAFGSFVVLFGRGKRVGQNGVDARM